MKTFVPALLVALAGVATAQLPDLPQCSLQCFLTALGSDGCSDLTDFKCHCEKSSALFASVTPCVQSACSAEEQAEVIKGVENTCASAGVSIDVPEPSATAAPSSASSEAASSAEPTEASSSAPAPTESGSYSAAPTLSSSVSAAPSATGNGTAPSVPAPTTGSPSPTSFPGAASRVGQALGLVGAAAVAAVFAL